MTRRQMKIGMLHTVPALAPELEKRFLDQISADAVLSAADVQVVHLADSALLAAAIKGEDTSEGVLRDLLALQSLGVDAILVTCSSIGEQAEEASSKLSVPVARIDTGMALEAARLVAAAVPTKDAPRIAVLATVASTVAPSARLIARHSTNAQVETVMCEGAAQLRTQGDLEGHDRIIGEQIEANADADVIVLAQASMADAASNAQVDAPVLTSTALGISRFVHLLGQIDHLEEGEIDQ